MKKDTKTRYRLFNIKYPDDSIENQLAGEENIKSNIIATDENEAAIIAINEIMADIFHTVISFQEIIKVEDQPNLWSVTLVMEVINNLDHDEIRQWRTSFIVEEI